MYNLFDSDFVHMSRPYLSFSLTLIILIHYSLGLFFCNCASQLYWFHSTNESSNDWLNNHRVDWKKISCQLFWQSINCASHLLSKTFAGSSLLNVTIFEMYDAKWTVFGIIWIFSHFQTNQLIEIIRSRKNKQGIWQIVVISQLLNWLATEKMMNSENLKAHPATLSNSLAAVRPSVVYTVVNQSGNSGMTTIY